MLCSLSFMIFGCWLGDDDDDEQFGPTTGAIKLSAVADAGAGNAFAASGRDIDGLKAATIANKFVARIKIGASRPQFFNINRSDNGQTLTLDATLDGIAIGKQQLTIEIVASGVADAEPILKTIATATVAAGQTNEDAVKNVPINFETTAKALAYEAWPASGSKTIDDFAPSAAGITALANTIKNTLGASIDGTKTLNDTTIEDAAKELGEAVQTQPAATLSSIGLNPDTVSVATNGTFDLTTIVVTATYSDASTKAVTGHTWSVKSGGGSLSGSTYTPPTTAGTTFLTCTFTENSVTKTADLTLNVTGPARFSKDANNVITDIQTGLQWLCTTTPFSWYQARDWAAGLTLNGGGWRLPTRSELGALYPAAEGSQLFTVSYSWTTEKPFLDDPETATTDESQAYFFNYFQNFDAAYNCAADGGTTNNSIAVRSTIAGSVTGISMNKTSTTVAVDGSEALTITILPDNATSRTVVWKSSKESVATVDSTGKVTGVAIGKIIITASIADPALTAECVVTVTAPVVSADIELVNVPAGTFQRDASAANTSYVSAFKMSKYEITRAQFLAVMGTDPTETSYSNGLAGPVQQVSWYHAIAYCNKLSLSAGLTPAYSVSGVDFSTLTYAAIPTSTNSAWDAVICNWSANGYRLPTEMEWIWAAMGADSGNSGATNTSGYAKAFAGSTGSNLPGDYGWYTSNSSGKTHSVGSKLANELGLYDMSGNVSEWCWGWLSYPTGANSDYRGGTTGAYRVRLGSSFSVNNVSIANSGYEYPYSQDFYLGFRVVRP